MSKLRLFFLTVFLCYGAYLSAVTIADYNALQIGTSASELRATFGEPYAIYDKGNGVSEYEYIERIATENELFYESHYLITVANGQVVSKRIREEDRPPYDLMYQEDPNYQSYP